MNIKSQKNVHFMSLEQYLNGTLLGKCIHKFLLQTTPEELHVLNSLGINPSLTTTLNMVDPIGSKPSNNVTAENRIKFSV